MLSLTSLYIWIIVGVVGGLLVCVFVILLISLCYYCTKKVYPINDIDYNKLLMIHIMPHVNISCY